MILINGNMLFHCSFGVDPEDIIFRCVGFCMVKNGKIVEVFDNDGHKMNQAHIYNVVINYND